MNITKIMLTFLHIAKELISKKVFLSVYHLLKFIIKLQNLLFWILRWGNMKLNLINVVLIQSPQDSLLVFVYFTAFCLSEIKDFFQ